MVMATYTAEQRDEALALYMAYGTSETSRRTSIPKSTIDSWARRSRLRTVRNEKAAAATEAAQVDARAKRVRLQGLLLDQALEALTRMDETHKDFRGKDGQEVWWEKAPPEAMRHYAMACAVLIDKLRLEEGNATRGLSTSIPVSGRMRCWTSSPLGGSGFQRTRGEALRDRSPRGGVTSPARRNRVR